MRVKKGFIKVMGLSLLLLMLLPMVAFAEEVAVDSEGFIYFINEDDQHRIYITDEDETFSELFLDVQADPERGLHLVYPYLWFSGLDDEDNTYREMIFDFEEDMLITFMDDAYIVGSKNGLVYYIFDSVLFSYNPQQDNGDDIALQYIEEEDLLFIDLDSLMVYYLDADGDVYLDFVYESAKDFKDLKDTHWGYDYIQWAAGNNVITGFDDHTVRPNDQVTEAQFLSMFLRMYDIDGLESTQANDTWWAAAAYEYAKQHDIAINGYGNRAIANAPIKRGLVAKIIAESMVGETLTEDEAIMFLYEINLATGHSEGERTVASFKPEGTLTRAEAATFISRYAFTVARVLLQIQIDELE